MIKKFLLLVGVFFAVSFAFVSCKPVNIYADNTPVVKSIKNVRKVQGNVSDLTGTTWVFDDYLNDYNYLYDTFNGSGGPLIASINFTDNIRDYSSLYRYNNADDLDYLYYYTLAHDDYTAYNDGWTNSNYKTITITGGTDATNSTLINWLDTIATLQADVVEINDFVIYDTNNTVIFNSTNISGLSDTDKIYFYFNNSGLSYKVNGTGSAVAITTSAYYFPAFYLGIDLDDELNVVFNGTNSYQLLIHDMGADVMDFTSEYYIFSNTLISSIITNSTNSGYQSGYNDGLANGGDVWLTNNPFSAVMSAVNDFFNIEIMPGFKLYYLWIAGLGILFVSIVIKLWVH